MPLFPDWREPATQTFDRVAGEREAAAIGRTLSLQAKLTNLIVFGVALTFALVLLFWYYAHIAARRAPGQQVARPRADRHVSDDAALPPIGAIGFPITSAPAEWRALSGDNDAIGAEGTPSKAVSPGASPMPLLEDSRSGLATPTAPPSISPRAGPSGLQRRLSGDAFISNAGPINEPPGMQSSTAGPRLASEATMPVEAASPLRSIISSSPADGASDARAGSLSSLLQHQPAEIVEARLLPMQSLLLPKGSFIDCTLQTAIDSTLPGMTTCVTATDTFSADGRVVLLERGTKLVGETRGQVQQGAARVFVLWTEARTPTGVAVPLDSPAADTLGRSGLTGSVDRHFWERFGAAVLISVIEGGVQAGVQASAGRGGTVIYSPGAAQDVMSETLKGTLSIPPTVVVSNGERVQVLVARDVDFNNVYELRHASSSR